MMDKNRHVGVKMMLLRVKNNIIFDMVGVNDGETGMLG